jgi:hypothetical protein
MYVHQNLEISEYPVGESPHLLQNREICEHPVGESTHLLQNREICDIRIDYILSE